MRLMVFSLAYCVLAIAYLVHDVWFRGGKEWERERERETGKRGWVARVWKKRGGRKRDREREKERRNR